MLHPDCAMTVSMLLKNNKLPITERACMSRADAAVTVMMTPN